MSSGRAALAGVLAGGLVALATGDQLQPGEAFAAGVLIVAAILLLVGVDVAAAFARSRRDSARGGPRDTGDVSEEG